MPATDWCSRRTLAGMAAMAFCSLSFACGGAPSECDLPPSDSAECVPEDEIPYDGVDQDCDGADLTDVDGDGFESDFVGGTDCDDDDPSINLEADEIPYDGVDQDCDGADLTDVDGDGFESDMVGGGTATTMTRASIPKPPSNGTTE